MNLRFFLISLLGNSNPFGTRLEVADLHAGSVELAETTNKVDDKLAELADTTNKVDDKLAELEDATNKFAHEVKLQASTREISWKDAKDSIDEAMRTRIGNLINSWHFNWKRNIEEELRDGWEPWRIHCIEVMMGETPMRPGDDDRGDDWRKHGCTGEGVTQEVVGEVILGATIPDTFYANCLFTLDNGRFQLDEVDREIYDPICVTSVEARREVLPWGDNEEGILISVLKKPRACLDLSGKYEKPGFFSDKPVTMLQNGCSGESTATNRDTWKYTVFGNVVTTTTGKARTGKITGSRGSYIITWSDKSKYNQIPTPLGNVPFHGVAFTMLISCEGLAGEALKTCKALVRFIGAESQRFAASAWRLKQEAKEQSAASRVVTLQVPEGDVDLCYRADYFARGCAQLLGASAGARFQEWHSPVSVDFEEGRVRMPNPKDTNKKLVFDIKACQQSEDCKLRLPNVFREIAPWPSWRPPLWRLLIQALWVLQGGKRDLDTWMDRCVNSGAKLTADVAVADAAYAIGWVPHLVMALENMFDEDAEIPMGFSMISKVAGKFYQKWVACRNDPATVDWGTHRQCLLRFENVMQTLHLDTVDNVLKWIVAFAEGALKTIVSTLLLAVVGPIAAVRGILLGIINTVNNVRHNRFVVFQRCLSTSWDKTGGQLMNNLFLKFDDLLYGDEFTAVKRIPSEVLHYAPTYRDMAAEGWFPDPPPPVDQDIAMAQWTFNAKYQQGKLVFIDRDHPYTSFADELTYHKLPELRWIKPAGGMMSTKHKLEKMVSLLVNVAGELQVAAWSQEKAFLILTRSVKNVPAEAYRKRLKQEDKMNEAIQKVDETIEISRGNLAKYTQAIEDVQDMSFTLRMCHAEFSALLNDLLPAAEQASHKSRMQATKSVGNPLQALIEKAIGEIKASQKRRQDYLALQGRNESIELLEGPDEQDFEEWNAASVESEGEEVQGASKWYESVDIDEQQLVGDVAYSDSEIPQHQIVEESPIRRKSPMMGQQLQIMEEKERKNPVQLNLQTDQRLIREDSSIKMTNTVQREDMVQQKRQGASPRIRTKTLSDVSSSSGGTENILDDSVDAREPINMPIEFRIFEVTEKDRHRFQRVDELEDRANANEQILDTMVGDPDEENFIPQPDDEIITQQVQTTKLSQTPIFAMGSPNQIEEQNKPAKNTKGDPRSKKANSENVRRDGSL